MRYEYITIEFLNGKIISNLQCRSSSVKDDVLSVFEPYNKSGYPRYNETDNYPLSNILRWTSKVYR